MITSLLLTCKILTFVKDEWSGLTQFSINEIPVKVMRNAFYSPLTHFSRVSHFYTKGFLTFSGGIEMWHSTKMG